MLESSSLSTPAASWVIFGHKLVERKDREVSLRSGVSENQGFVTNRVKLLECLEHLMGMEWSQSPIEGADGGPEGGDDDHLLHHLLLLLAAA